jgi:hemoglobin
VNEQDRDLMRQEVRANLWQEVGGDPTFRTLVEAFYRRVEADPLLRPIFPPDLASGREKQFLFLAQYFGAPARYSEQHGHPRLRMRHFPFAITRAARDRWLAHMLEAVDEAGIAEPWRTEMRAYFEMASQAMINRSD